MLDVMEQYHCESERDNGVKEGSAFVGEKRCNKSNDEKYVGYHAFGTVTQPRNTLTSSPSSRGRPTDT